MKAVADNNMTAIAETFGRHMSVRALPGRNIRRENLIDTDVLLVRSVTRVDSDLLQDTPVRFVGSATIGTDHMDTEWLDSAGIRWAAAPGCNADAAAQYTLGMILLALHRLGRTLDGARVGVIGCGNVGRRVVELVAILGARVVACDPPLADDGKTGLVDLHNALDSDIVSLHVPLTRLAPYPTERMLDARTIEQMRPGALLVNASRGRVVDGPSLQDALDAGRIHAALDVWPDEPAIARGLLDRVTVATPHVAGYSALGRHRGTAMIYTAWQTHSGVATASLKQCQGSPSVITIDPVTDDPVADAVVSVTRVGADDDTLRHTHPLDAAAFDALRAGYPLRREFAEAYVPATLAETARTRLRAIGFGAADQAPVS
ncbi:4-phosphoerythronate dehydrogenase [Marinihelvus fidelis]|uniref:Erythronate-4-phosphate dehydrogenase n=1 Tax=Marinihelvus fidelis TaxID=2613842 RepID=A0A5N0TAW9_9GAMM|nr:4-phosphoerythronate dehydrogenase [Marinihelvus fidelis]KAA9131818.1 4-phosphoerythronate dehydrogenase [Marinihelvus fidelis]